MAVPGNPIANPNPQKPVGISIKINEKNQKPQKTNDLHGAPSRQLLSVTSADTKTKAPTNSNGKSNAKAVEDRRDMWSPYIVWTAASICLVAGVMCNIAVKMQNRQTQHVCGDISDPECDIQSWNFPFWQTLIMMCAESVALVLFLCDHFISLKWRGGQRVLDFSPKRRRDVDLDVQTVLKSSSSISSFGSSQFDSIGPSTPQRNVLESENGHHFSDLFETDAYRVVTKCSSFVNSNENEKFAEIAEMDREGTSILPTHVSEVEADAEERNPLTHVLWFAIPAIFDLVGTGMINIAFVITFVSTVQMIRNFVLICTSLLGMIFLRRPLRVYEWMGIGIMTAGMILSGIQAILVPDTTSAVQDDKAYLGIVMTLVGTVFNAAHLISEEKIFSKRHIPPLAALGVEGSFGLVMNVSLLFVLHSMGYYNMNHMWYMMNNNTKITIGNVWYLFSSISFNCSGIITTAVSSGMLRAVIFSSRAPIAFVLELIIGWQSFAWLQLAGLVLVTVGFFAFNGMGGLRNNPRLRRGVNFACTSPLDDDI